MAAGGAIPTWTRRGDCMVAAVAVHPSVQGVLLDLGRDVLAQTPDHPLGEPNERLDATDGVPCRGLADAGKPRPVVPDQDEAMYLQGIVDRGCERCELEWVHGAAACGL